MDIFLWATNWAPSTIIWAPYLWASLAALLISFKYPVTLDAPLIVTYFTFPQYFISISSRSSIFTLPLSSTSKYFKLHFPIQGKSFEWCSILVVITTSSLSLINILDNLFIPIVVLSVKIAVYKSWGALK